MMQETSLTELFPLEFFSHSNTPNYFLPVPQESKAQQYDSVPDVSIQLAKEQQIAIIFGSEPIRSTPQEFLSQDLLNKYCIWDIHDLINMEKEVALKQKEDFCYKLLENYSYEKITTYDTNKEKEIWIFKCKHDDCDKIVNTPWSLLDHIRMHEGVKPHQCDWWGKTFTQRGNLKKHVRQHINPDVNDRKRFRCRFCEKGYTERYNLKVNLVEF